MTNEMNDLINSIQKAMDLPKCRKCACMKESLETMKKELLKSGDGGHSKLFFELERALKKTEPAEYT